MLVDRDVALIAGKAALALAEIHFCNEDSEAASTFGARAMQLIEQVLVDVPDLPEGFADKHGKDNTESDDAADFLTKSELLG